MGQLRCTYFEDSYMDNAMGMIGIKAMDFLSVCISTSVN